MAVLPHVPIGWFTAEVAAENMVAGPAGGSDRATLYRGATVGVLALTWFLADVDASPFADLEPAGRAIRPRLSSDPRWLTWCCTRLADRSAVSSDPNAMLAHHTWNWLTELRLQPSPSLNALTGYSRPTTAYRIGLPLARWIVDDLCDQTA